MGIHNDKTNVQVPTCGEEPHVPGVVVRLAALGEVLEQRRGREARHRLEEVHEGLSIK